MERIERIYKGIGKNPAQQETPRNYQNKGLPSNKTKVRS